MLNFVAGLLCEGNLYVVYAASCRLNALHANLTAAHKIEHFEELEVCEKMRFLLVAHALDRPEELSVGHTKVQVP